MALTSAFNFILLGAQICLPVVLCESASGSMGSQATGESSSSSMWPQRLRLHRLRSSHADAHATLEALLHGNHGASETELTKIEAVMAPTFQALPKNAMGRLAPRSVRHMIHSYFASEHGLLIRGMENHGMQLNMTGVHDADVLVKKMPVLADVLSKVRKSDRGLSFTDVILTVATLERLMLEESTELLSVAYLLNGFDPSQHVQRDALQEVLISYLIIFELGSKANVTDVAKHELMKLNLKTQNSQSWSALVEFEEDALNTCNYLQQDTINPFVPAVYSFQAASRVVRSMARAYGQWQNTECRQMASDLRGLDTMGSGRVPLDKFYLQPKSMDYLFTESTMYLRQIGALDEGGSSGKPQVRIANYLMGPSNCIASSSYFSVCCLSECEGLMRELEQKVQAPTAPAEQLLSLVGNMSSSSVEAPRELPANLVDKLQVIAERHQGNVPLHARLFAQWIHFAFPSECPYPHLVEDAVVLRPSHWSGQQQATATDEERQRCISESAAQPEATMEESLLSQWDDVEVLLLEDVIWRGNWSFWTMLRVVALALALLSTVLAGLQALVHFPCRRGKTSPKDDMLVLPVSL